MEDKSFSLFDVPSTTGGGTKLPICLILDTSGSMAGTEQSGRGAVVKIDEVNRNMINLLETIRNDANARLITDICIIQCGGNAPTVVCGYTSVDKLRFLPLKANGRTPLGTSVDLALDLLQKRRQYYRDNSVEHYKPIMLIMSDGMPTDEYVDPARRCCDFVVNEGLKVLPIGIGGDAKLDILKQFSPVNPAVIIHDMDVFSEMFQLLSRSTSNPADNSVFDWLNEQV